MLGFELIWMWGKDLIHKPPTFDVNRDIKIL